MYTVTQKKVSHFYFCDKFGKTGPICIFFTVIFRKDLQSKLNFKIPPPLKSVATLPCEMWVSTIQKLYSTVNSVQSNTKRFNCSTCSRGRLFLCLFTHINQQHVFKMFSFVTYACFESGMLLVNGCVDCALFNAVLNVYLHNWKLTEQTKYHNNVTKTSVSGKKQISK